MKPGARSSTKIMSEWDLRQEAKKYLYFLANKFRLAVNQVNRRNTSFEILPNLTIGDIYNESDFTFDQFSEVTIDQLEAKVKKLIDEVNSLDPFVYFIETSSVIALNSSETYLLYDEFREIEREIFDPSERIFTVLGSLYIKRLQELTDELIDNDSNCGFNFYFHFLFETKSANGIQSWLENRCKTFSEHEARCIYLFKLVNKFRDEYLGHRALPSEGDTIEFVDPSICQEKIVRDGCVSYNFTTIEEAPCSEAFLSIFKIALNNFSKITVNGFRNRLAIELKTLYVKRPGDIDNFIETHFHFVGQDWMPMVEVSDFPIFMSTKLAFILNCYKEEGLLGVRSKEYLIHWLAFRFYGWEGYTPHTIRRPFYNKSNRKSQRRIRKKLLERLESEYLGLFNGPKILHFLN